MHGHLLAERGHLLRKAVTGLGSQSSEPSAEDRLRRLEEPDDVGGVEAARPRQRRQPGAVQDLVGVGVADAAEEMRIGEGPLQRVVLLHQRSSERREVGVERFEPAGLMGRQGRFAAHKVERCPLLRARLREDERAAGEVERGRSDLAGHLRPRLLPVQPARDHEMQHEEQVVVELEDDALAEPAQAADRLAEDGVDRRVEGAEEKRIGEPDLRQRLADDAGAEAVDVGDDVGKFGHGRMLSHRPEPARARTRSSPPLDMRVVTECPLRPHARRARAAS